MFRAAFCPPWISAWRCSTSFSSRSFWRSSLSLFCSKAYTLDAAYVLDLEDRIGSLQPGKLADIVVLKKDLHKISPSEISTTKVVLTMMNGKVTFQSQ